MERERAWIERERAWIERERSLLVKIDRLKQVKTPQAEVDLTRDTFVKIEPNVANNDAANRAHHLHHNLKEKTNANFKSDDFNCVRQLARAWICACGDRYSNFSGMFNDYCKDFTDIRLSEESFTDELVELGYKMITIVYKSGIGDYKDKKSVMSYPR
jgi:hypothetical protein